MNYLLNHTSLETAYKVDNYPYGFRLRTTIFYWIETVAKKGDRFCSATINPKNGKMNAPKKSTFTGLKFLCLNATNGHVETASAGIYTDREVIIKLVESVGIDNLLPEQRKMYNQLLGINEVVRDEFTDKIKKDFSIKWEKDRDGLCDELKITFDRPDGVQLMEIYNAMRSVNQTRLKEVFTIRHSKNWGDHAGTVRICTRGGMQLTTVSEESYKEWQAMDFNLVEA